MSDFTFETTSTTSVKPDYEDYQYDVTLSKHEYSVMYKENNGYSTILNFGNIDEMRAVAEVMLEMCDARSRQEGA